MTIFHDAPLPSRTSGAVLRPTLGTTQPVGAGGKVTLLFGLTVADRPVAYFGEAPSGGAKLFRLALVNAWAPDKLLYLADFFSTQTLAGGFQARLVDP